MSNNFQTRLKCLRESSGYRSQSSFAADFGTAQSTVAGWESGKREPSYETTEKLANFFGVSVDYLLGRVDERFFSQETSKAICENILNEHSRHPEKFRDFIIPEDIWKKIENKTYSFSDVTFQQFSKIMEKSLEDILLVGKNTGQKEKAPAPITESERNIVKIAGRDGSFVERRLTDDQVEALRSIIDQFPEAGDDI